MSDVQMVILMPEEGKAALINWWDAAAQQANEFTDACVQILVEKHKAVRELIKRDIFFDTSIGRLMDGKELDEPQAFVERAIRIYRAECLGL